ncbi:hypothetical protein [Paraburkholderia adhaesiva]|uniref:hypothetical protein n=1 Tax=Paraburkholderia adhaesiva TaxID=2883244 RepID=UPI001F1C977D|nr:hypothetical protein [Paraburkholderia adhaesiva]
MPESTGTQENESANLKIRLEVVMNRLRKAGYPVSLSSDMPLRLRVVTRDEIAVAHLNPDDVDQFLADHPCGPRKQMPTPGTGEITQAQAAGFRVHQGQAADGAELDGRWWWTLSQPGWVEAESGDASFPDEMGAWADAVRELWRDPRLVLSGKDDVCAEAGAQAIVLVSIPELMHRFSAEQSLSPAMRMVRIGQAIKAWHVADHADEIHDTPESAPSTLVCMLSDLRHDCEANQLDFTKLVGESYTECQLTKHHHAAKETPVNVLPHDAQECLMDFISHHGDFIKACRFIADAQTGSDDRLYWQHQIDVLERMKRQANRVLDYLSGKTPMIS